MLVWVTLSLFEEFFVKMVKVGDYIFLRMDRLRIDMKNIQKLEVTKVGRKYFLR